MIDFQKIEEAIRNNIYLEVDEKDLKSIFIPKLNFKEIYLLTKYLYLFKNSNGNYDKKIIENYQHLLDHGLTIEKDKDLFLDVLCILSELCFKYGLYKHASNYLLLLRDNYPKENLPIWIYNYSAKIYFKEDPFLAFLTPEVILNFLTKDGEIDLEDNPQGKNILKEFLLTLADSFKDNIEKNNFINQESVSNFYKSIKPFLKIISKEWISLLETIIEKYQDRNNFYNLLLELNIFQQVLEEKKIQYEELYNKYIELDNKYKELLPSIESVEKKVTTLSKKQIKILILGASEIKEKYIFGIAKEYGLMKEQLDLMLDYNKNKRFDINKLKYNSPYAGILIGPIAHKITGQGDFNTLIEKMKNEEGFPPFKTIKTLSGELKISKTAFKEALEQLLVIINANIPC